MPRAIHVNSIGELRAAASLWDDLWQRSDATSPLARAAPVAQWLEHFAPRARFQAIVIEHDGRWVAALPLVARRKAWLLRSGVLPCNYWPSGATLLWDMATTNDPDIGRALANAIGRWPGDLVFLEAAMPQRASWQALCRAVSDAGLASDLRTRWQVGRLAIHHERPAGAGLSRKHRQRLASSLRKLEALGEVRFDLHTQFTVEDVEPLLRRALETEARSWKGEASSAVTSTAGAADYLIRQALQLAAEGQLLMAFLDCGGRNVAFCYGAVGKGIFHSYKIGYDAEFARFSPGHLLQYRLLEAFHADGRIVGVDYIGPLTEYHASWRPEAYAFARLVIAARGSLFGRAALAYVSGTFGRNGQDTELSGIPE